MELVNKDMGALALLPVQRHAVEHGVRDHQQAGGLELGIETVNVEHHDTLIEVHIGLLAEDVQRTGDIELNAICFASGSGCSSSISRRVQRVEILYATTKLLILQSPN